MLISCMINCRGRVLSVSCSPLSPDKCEPENIFTLRKSFPTHNIKNSSAYSKSQRHLYLECPHGGINGCLEAEFSIGFKIYIYI